MDIPTVRSKKEELEKEILKMILSFELETDANVEGISLYKVDGYGNNTSKNSLIELKVEI